MRKLCAKIEEKLSISHLWGHLFVLCSSKVKKQSTALLWRDSKELDDSSLLKGLEHELAGLPGPTSWLPVHALAPMAPATV